MKRRALLGIQMAAAFLAAAVLLALPCAAWAETTTTVLVYLCGGDLETDLGCATEDLEEMVESGIVENGPVRVLVQTGGAKKWESEEVDGERMCRFKVDRLGLHLLESDTEHSMGRPGMLAKFLNFGLATAPADRYILVLWGHGGGVTGGICSDERHSDDSLMPDELARALEEGLESVHLDAVMLDACLMGSLDIAEILAPYADFMVASQASTPSSGLRYHRWLSDLVENPDVAVREICERAASSYIKLINYGKADKAYTASVLDLSRIQELSRASERLYNALDQRFMRAPGSVLDRRAQLRSFGEFDKDDPTDFVDALRIAEAFGDLEPQCCEEMRHAVLQAVIYNGATDRMAGEACGVSLTMPYAARKWFDEFRDYYEPKSERSGYARLIVDMIHQIESGEIPALPDDKPNGRPSKDARRTILESERNPNRRSA